MNIIHKQPYSPSTKWTMMKTTNTRRKPLPLFLSTNPSHVNLSHLQNLYTTCNLSCHRFPNMLNGLVEPVDINKLSIAVSNSFVVVSVFSRVEDNVNTGKGFLERVMVPPLTHLNGELVGFGRAVSDSSLTAAIHDVMVAPSLRGMGIGRMIVQRIIKMLTVRDIYDIAAVCSENERLFFEACGFGDDILGSTTMMYTRTISKSHKGNEMVTRAGQRLLLMPSCREPLERQPIKP